MYALNTYMLDETKYYYHIMLLDEGTKYFPTFSVIQSRNFYI
jgi:hypothetical protein